MTHTVHVVRTGVANVASVAAALTRAGATPVLTDDADEIRAAAAVVLPGVGSFDAGMGQLIERGLAEPLRARIAGGAPTLCICLGMQLLALSSEESGADGHRGLCILDARVKLLEGASRLPHFGWNRIDADPEATLLRSCDVYFAHTYALAQAGPLQGAGWRVALAQEGSTFVAAIERGAVLACQFHPELSGADGAALIVRWLDHAGIERGAGPTAGGTVQW